MFWPLWPLAGLQGILDGALAGLALSPQGVFLWTLRVCTLGFWVPKPWSMALNKGIWDPKLRYIH